MHSVSAVIRTWNSAETLDKTLGSLRAQRPSIDEIVVVDSGSTDSTLDIVSHHKCKLITYPQSQQFNYSHALNIGIASTAGDRILLLSSHVTLCYSNIVELMSHYLDEFDAAGAYCRFQVSGKDLLEESHPLRGKLVDLIFLDNFQGINGLWNPCSLISRASWEAHSFCESMPTAEDQEWAQWHYLNSGKPTVCVRNAGVLYMNPYNSLRKHAFEYAVVAHRVFPRLKTWRSIAGLCRRSLVSAMTGDSAESKTLIYCAWETARAHFSTSHWHSRVHLGRQQSARGKIDYPRS